jgi:hypothetical protein
MRSTAPDANLQAAILACNGICHTAMLIGCSLKVAGCHSGLEVVEGRVETLALRRGCEAQGSHRWTSKRRRCCTHADFLLLVELCWALFGVDYWMVLTLG